MTNSTTTRSKIGYIDGLKGIAILAVTIAHTGGDSLPGVFGRLSSDGARGVQLFFIITGILMFSSLDRLFSPNLSKKELIKNTALWYLRKFERLAPQFYTAMAVCFLTGYYTDYWLQFEGLDKFCNVLTHILMLHGISYRYFNSILGVEWYVGILWLFILISPALYKITNSFKKALLLLFSSLVLCFLINKFWTITPNPGWSTEDLINFRQYRDTSGPHVSFVPFAMGIVLFFVLFRSNWLHKGNEMTRRILSYCLLITGAGLVFIQNCGVQPLPFISRNNTFSLWFCIIIISQAIHSSVLIDNPVFRLLGKYSYGIYLFQFIVIDFYNDYINYYGPLSWTVKFAVCLILLLSVSKVMTAASNRLIKSLKSHINNR